MCQVTWSLREDGRYRARVDAGNCAKRQRRLVLDYLFCGVMLLLRAAVCFWSFRWRETACDPVTATARETIFFFFFFTCPSFRGSNYEQESENPVPQFRNMHQTGSSFSERWLRLQVWRVLRSLLQQVPLSSNRISYLSIPQLVTFDCRESRNKVPRSDSAALDTRA
jgi:hypothetical protein